MEIKIEKADLVPPAVLKCVSVIYLKYNTFLPQPEMELSKKYQIQVSKRKDKKK